VTRSGPEGTGPQRTDQELTTSNPQAPEPTDGQRSDLKRPDPERPDLEHTDRELLQAHVDGDPAAFGALVARHQDRLWAIALRMMRNSHDAADALQDAYISAFRRAHTYRGEAQVTTWLHRVVVNACLDRLRVSQARRTEPLPEDWEPSRRGGLGPDDPAGLLDPLELSEERGAVTAALGQLNADQRAALILVDMEGYSVEETAAMLGCAPGTIKSRCARGRAKLVPLLGHLRAAVPAAEGP